MPAIQNRMLTDRSLAKDLVDDLASDLVVTFLVEKNHISKIELEEAKTLIEKIRLALLADGGSHFSGPAASGSTTEESGGTAQLAD